MFFRQRRPLEPNKATKAERHQAPSPESLQSDQNNLTNSQRSVLSMQHLHGNRAVLRMLARSRGTVAQRDPQVGWNTRGGKATTSANQGETLIAPEGTSTKPGSMRRIPIRGLVHGSESDDSDAEDFLGRKSSSMTKETASESQAIVVIPEKLDVNQDVAVLFHIHGKTIGYREDKSGKLEDVDFARIEQQLQASGLNMIAVLPQGALRDVARSCPNFGSVNRENLINDVFTYLNDKKMWTNTASDKDVQPNRGRLVLSTHSCGGFKATPMLEDDVSAKNIKAGNINPANMAGVLLFDSIHDDNQANQVISWLNAQMSHDLTELKKLADDSKTPKNAQLKYLKSSMQFRGIFSHTSNDAYANAYAPVIKALDNWYKTNNDQINKVMTPDVLSVFKNNYQVIDSGHSDHMTVMSQGDQLKQALGALNLPAIGSKATTPIPVTPKSSGTVPAGVGSASGSANVQKKTLVDGSLQCQPAPDASGNNGTKGQTAITPDRALTDTAIHLAETGGTRLQPDYVRTRLQNRSSDAALSTEFRQLLMVILADKIFQQFQQSMPMGMGMGIPFIVDIVARDLIKFLEKQFVYDPNASTLDLLARGQSYRNRRWDRLDYPGHAKDEAEGPHEDEARQMMADLAAVEGERRPNTGTTAVVTQSEFTSSERLQTYIAKKLKNVPDLPADPGKRARAVKQTDQRLNETALADFLRMRQDADQEGVELIIVDGYRTPATSQAHSKDQNPSAIASYSSHNLGLAMDLQMSHGSQQYLETTTRPMQNVVDMHQSPAHKWMFLHGPDYGWFPWHFEPWHWEYNPTGFRDTLQTDFQQWQVDNPATPARRR